MLRLISWLITGCFHKWNIDKTVKVIDNDKSYFADDYLLRCEKCGIIKKVRT